MGGTSFAWRLCPGHLGSEVFPLPFGYQRRCAKDGIPNTINVKESLAFQEMALLVWFGLVWFSLVWFGVGLVWFGLVWCDLVWCAVVLIGMEWYSAV